MWRRKTITERSVLGLAEREWKSRFYNHQLSFKHNYSNQKELLNKRSELCKCRHASKFILKNYTGKECR